jgi:hypothetical protein
MADLAADETEPTDLVPAADLNVEVEFEVEVEPETAAAPLLIALEVFAVFDRLTVAETPLVAFAPDEIALGALAVDGLGADGLDVEADAVLFPLTPDTAAAPALMLPPPPLGLLAA